MEQSVRYQGPMEQSVRYEGPTERWLPTALHPRPHRYAHDHRLRLSDRMDQHSHHLHRCPASRLAPVCRERRVTRSARKVSCRAWRRASPPSRAPLRARSTAPSRFPSCSIRSPCPSSAGRSAKMRPEHAFDGPPISSAWITVDGCHAEMLTIRNSTCWLGQTVCMGRPPHAYRGTRPHAVKRVKSTDATSVIALRAHPHAAPSSISLI